MAQRPICFRDVNATQDVEVTRVKVAEDGADAREYRSNPMLIPVLKD